jgi:GTPase SAR1 family protein
MGTVIAMAGKGGTGKTTLSRKLIQALSLREGFVFHIVLDPTYEDERMFFSSLEAVEIYYDRAYTRKPTGDPSMDVPTSPSAFLAAAILISATAISENTPLDASVFVATLPTAPPPPKTVTLDIFFLLSKI